MENESMCRVPVVGCMVMGADGEYHLNKDRSEWADIPADTIARFLLEKFGKDVIFKGAGD